MQEYTTLLEDLGDWVAIRAELAGRLNTEANPHMQWTINQEIMVVDAHTVEIRELLADMDEIHYEDHYAHIVDVEIEQVEEWELLPTYEPSHIHKTRMPLAA